MRPRRSGFRWLMQEAGPGQPLVTAEEVHRAPGCPLKRQRDEGGRAGGSRRGLQWGFISDAPLGVPARPSLDTRWPGVGRGSVGLSAEGP